MGPERRQRFVLLAVMCVLLAVTSWMENYLDQMVGASPTFAPTPPSSSTKMKMEEAKKGRGRKSDHGWRSDEEEDDDDVEHLHFKSLKTKARMLENSMSLQLDLHACLPRFICELHSQASGAVLTDFEKDVLGLFRNHVVLEGPSSPVYRYQVAAHMGQLCSGLDPSPCHSLYPACPLSRTLLIQVLTSVKSSRRMFY